MQRIKYGLYEFKGLFEDIELAIKAANDKEIVKDLNQAEVLIMEGCCTSIFPEWERRILFHSKDGYKEASSVPAFLPLKMIKWSGKEGADLTLFELSKDDTGELCYRELETYKEGIINNEKP